MRISLDLETLPVEALALIGEGLADAANHARGDARKLALYQVTAVVIELESRDESGPRLPADLRELIPPTQPGGREGGR